MQAFSSTVRDMYALAEYAAPDQFLTQAINLLQMWIRFDGAIFGTGEGAQKTPSDYKLQTTSNVTRRRRASNTVRLQTTDYRLKAMIPWSGHGKV